MEQNRRLENVRSSSQSFDCASLTSSTNFQSDNGGNVTQCVLAMLNDLTCTSDVNKHKEFEPPSVSVTRKRYRRTPFPRDDYEDSSDSDMTDSDCSSCCSEYHLYEEIIYGDNKQCPVDAPRPPSPPPLPIRPSSLLKGSESESTPKSTQVSPIGQQSSAVITKTCYRCMCHSRMHRGLVNKSPSKSVPYINKDAIVQTERESQKMAKLKSFFGESPPPTPPIRTTSQTVFICPKVEESVQNKPDTKPSLVEIPLPKESSIYPTKSTPIPIAEGLLPKNCPNKPPPPPRTSSANGIGKSYVSTSNENSMESINSTVELLPSHSSRPKQRNNIYSIFKERHCRRFVSDSLEKECEDQAAQQVTLDIQCNERCEREDSCSTKSVPANRPNGFQSSYLSVNPVRKSSLPNSLSPAANSCANIGQQQLASDASSHRTPKANDEETLHIPKPNRIVTCSIDANQQYEDDYGFYPFTHIV